EEAVGREPFDRFVRAYVSTFRFRSITTDDFLALLRSELPGALERIDAAAWLDAPGLPADAPRPHSAKLEAVERIGARVPETEEVRGWTATEWQLYLESLPPLDEPFCRALDERHALTTRGNMEVLVAWLTAACAAGYVPAQDRTAEVLGAVGRMKYLKPLYQALLARPETRGVARHTFETHADGYHPIARQVIQQLLSQRGA
ncbi:MAG: leukotriene A4 hydrolase C-terminal domain-containing protein, partial [Myxococcales bacterium]